MMTQAFYTGLSGLKSTQTGIDILSDNMANIDTVGFRGYDGEFSSLLEHSLSTTNDKKTNISSVGVGTRLASTAMNEKNGELLLSDRNTDLAIDGDGWFGVKSGENTFFTRAGNFNFDSNNDLVTDSGGYVLGTMANNIKDTTLTKIVPETGLGDINAQETLRFPKYLHFPAQPTTKSSFYGNLSLAEDKIVFGSTVIDVDNNKNNLKLLFTKSENQPKLGVAWDVKATIESLDGLVIHNTKNGVVNFSEKGALLSNTLNSIDNNGTTINIDLGEDFNGVISNDTPYKIGSSKSNGTKGGDLIGYEVNQNAEVIASFTNGMQSSVGKIALYHFQNDQGLNRISSTNFQESSNSGKALFFKDANGKNILGGSVTNYKLENSNVLMAPSLTQLIIYQRSFDANSKSVTVADELIKKALDM